MAVWGSLGSLKSGAGLLRAAPNSTLSDPADAEITDHFAIVARCGLLCRAATRVVTKKVFVTAGGGLIARWMCDNGGMRYVYIIQSVGFPEKRYVGITSDLKRRLRDHNAGGSAHTAKYKPWKVETYVAFVDERKARKFERYIKQGSGWAFAKKHLWGD